MRSSTILSLVIAFVLAAAAVFGMREYLSDQKALLLAMNGMKAEERTLVVADKPMR
ncbi:Flp pilus assembly protein CpaB, partial [Rhizobium leguminosarum]